MNLKQTLKLIAFNLIFIILLVGTTYALRTSGDIKDIFNGFYAEKSDSIDVVMIGSSPVYPFYSGALIYGEKGYTCYPLSSHVQRPAAAIPLIKEAKKHQNPDLFVFEMRMYTMEDDRMEEKLAFARGVTDNLKYSLNRVNTINRMIPSSEDRLSYYLDIFKYHSNWRSVSDINQLKSVFGQRKSLTKGFFIRDDVEALKEAERLLSLDRIRELKDSGETMPIPKEQEEILYELLNYLRDNEIKGLFIVSPYDLSEEQMLMYNYTKKIVESYGFEFVNFNEYYEEIGIDFETDYYDGGSHVNILGAEKCSRYLANLLGQYGLKDHRGDRKYYSWDKAYEIVNDGLLKAKGQL